MTRKNVKSKVKLGKKSAKRILIAIVVIVLVLAIATGIIYWQKPDMFWQGVAFVQELFTPNNQSAEETLQRGEGELQVHFIDVGQGDCILILFPDGKTMMIDAGNSSNSSERKESMLSYVESYVTDKEIDFLMLTHADSDHCYYLDEVLNEYDVNTIYMPNILSTKASSSLPNEKLKLFTDDDTIDTNVYANFFNAALVEVDAEIVLNIGVFKIETENYRLTFYCPTQEFWDNNSLSSPEKKNAISPIGILEYNGFKVLFTGDSNDMNEPLFMDAVGEAVDCDVLKVAHHGSETSSIASFLDFVDCEHAVISVGEGNSHGHPTQEALERFEARKMDVYRTDYHGNIVLSITTTIDFVLQKAA